MKHHQEIAEYFNRRGVSLIFLLRRNLLQRYVSILANDYGRNTRKLIGTHKAHEHHGANSVINFILCLQLLVSHSKDEPPTFFTPLTILFVVLLWMYLPDIWIKFSHSIYIPGNLDALVRYRHKHLTANLLGVSSPRRDGWLQHFHCANHLHHLGWTLRHVGDPHEVLTTQQNWLLTT